MCVCSWLCVCVCCALFQTVQMSSVSDSQTVRAARPTRGAVSGVRTGSVSLPPATALW